MTVAVAVKDNFFSHFTANEGFFFDFFLRFDDVDRRLNNIVLLEHIQTSQYQVLRKILYLFQKNAAPPLNSIRVCQVEDYIKIVPTFTILWLLMHGGY